MTKRLARCAAIAWISHACISFESTLPAKTVVDLGDPSSGSTGSSGAPTGETGETGVTGPTSVTGPVLSLLGTTCANGNECASGFCVDGVCCNEACGDSCVRCDVSGKVGTCSNSNSAPSADRAPCAASVAACAGSCNGSQRQCVYPGASTSCGASCDGQCSGTGLCTSVGACPNNFACGGSSCLTACSSDTDCAPNFECAAPPACTRKAEANCLDGVDDNGDGLADCADPTCLGDEVECVDDPGGGAQLGYVSSAACATEYPAAATIHQGPGPNVGAACTASCSCTPPATSVLVDMESYSVSDCSTSGSQFISEAPILSTQADNTCLYSEAAGCVSGSRPIALRTIVANGILISSCTGAANLSGTTTKPPATWTTTRTYCAAAQKTSTCPAGKSCVRIVAQKRCVRVSGASSCTGPTYSSQQSWFAAFGADTRACTACSGLTCSATAKTLSSLILRGQDNTSPVHTCTPGGPGPLALSNTAGIRWPTHDANCAAGPGDCSNNGCYNHFCSLTVDSALWTGGSCNVTSSPSVISGAVAGSGPSTTCCEP